MEHFWILDRVMCEIGTHKNDPVSLRALYACAEGFGKSAVLSSKNRDDAGVLFERAFDQAVSPVWTVVIDDDDFKIPIGRLEFKDFLYKKDDVLRFIVCR